MGAKITVRYWAAAQRAAGAESESLTAATLGDLRAALAERDGFEQLAEVVAFLVDGQQAGETTPLPAGAVVDVLPPFAGG